MVWPFNDGILTYFIMSFIAQINTLIKSESCEKTIHRHHIPSIRSRIKQWNYPFYVNCTDHWSLAYGSKDVETYVRCQYLLTCDCEICYRLGDETPHEVHEVHGPCATNLFLIALDYQGKCDERSRLSIKLAS